MFFLVAHTPDPTTLTTLHAILKSILQTPRITIALSFLTRKCSQGKGGSLFKISFCVVGNASLVTVCLLPIPSDLARVFERMAVAAKEGDLGCIGIGEVDRVRKACLG